MLSRACHMLLRVNVYMCMSQHRDAPGPDTSCCPHPPLMHLPPRQGKERPWMARVGFTVTCLHRAHRSSYPFYPTPRLHVCVYVCVCMRVGERERECVCVCACRCALPNFFYCHASLCVVCGVSPRGPAAVAQPCLISFSFSLSFYCALPCAAWSRIYAGALTLLAGINRWRDSTFVFVQLDTCTFVLVRRLASSAPPPPAVVIHSVSYPSHRNARCSRPVVSYGPPVRLVQERY